MPPSVTEDDLEQATLGWLGELGYTVVHGRDIAPGEPAAERAAFSDVVLKNRFCDAFTRLNPGVSSATVDDAFYQVTHPSDSPSLPEQNRAFHRMLVNGVEVEHQLEDGSSGYGPFRLADFDRPDNNDWLAVNQFAVCEDNNTRRPDIVLFVNGLPLAVLELKNPADEKTTARAAFNQLQTYKEQIPSLFVFNESLVASDGMQARIGSLSAEWQRFMPWRTVAGDAPAAAAELELEVLVRGVFERSRFLEIINYCTVFEDRGAATVKIMAAYHQYHAVRVGVAETLRASQAARVEDTGVYYARPSAGQPGDRRIGVVWHTQGSGKSLTMAFYAGWVAREPRMRNPTIVVLTDRNDLDEQLFSTFSACADILRQQPQQADSRAALRDLLRVASGGVVFTTIQKFLPEAKGGAHPVLSERQNIVVIADEAHRSQYDFIDGFARHMRDALPFASFVGFTATPISNKDGNTRSVFGDDISVYDIARAQRDGATVPIYYESRVAKLDLDPTERPNIDPDFEEVTEGEEEAHRNRLKSKWSALESIAGTDKRIRLIAGDLVDHFESRIETMRGKCMVVCMSRRICVEMFDAITDLRLDWRDDDDDERGAIKVVMTGSAADPLAFQPHIRSKAARERLRHRFRDPDDPLQMVIVRDMWLTGFDAPCLHTMYVDKPMRGHGLMQAIARVNRVFRDKPGGLVVDYLGLANNLRQAVQTYTEGRGRGRVTVDLEEAVAAMREKYEICRDMLHGCDWSAWRGGDAAARLKLLPAAQDCILAQENGKARFAKAVTQLSQAFALAVPHKAAIGIRDDVGFFQAVRAALSKSAGRAPRPEEEIEHAIRQIVSKAIAPEHVEDIFAAAGLAKPDISILSDEFLAEVRGMPHRNLAVELLRKLLRNQVKLGGKKNIVQARTFAEMLEQSLRAYQNRAIETAEVIEQLIALAKEMREASARGEKLNLNDDEVAFYDALGTNDSAVKVLGDETLKAIARELVNKVRANVSLDWNLKESVRADLRVMVKHILRKHGYPPDKAEQATDTVLEQAEVLCEDWLGAQD